MFKSIKIWWLKRQARRWYLLATTIPDYMDCGITMAKYIRPEMLQAEYAYDNIADKLTALNESIPEFRFHKS